MSRIGAPVPASNRADGGRRRLAALTAGLMLPGVALVVAGLNGDVIAWQVVGIGTMLLSAFVVVRMSGLLEVVEVQSVQLAALARSDPLTGAPNRRTWDHELSRACRHSRDTGDPLCVAILDLDNFKRFNDSFGHQAGDLLLREAVAAWVHRLEDRALLARYGGEEFAVLLPGFSLVEAMAVVQSLAEVMPQAQTFSAGVAAWEPTSEPALAIAHADQALHVAKRNGRDRVVVHPGGGADPVDESGLPAYSVLLQPLFDLRTGRVIGHEALCRFDEPGVDPEAGFQLAHDRGWGDLLEVAAIRTAMALPGRPPRTQLYVNVSMTALDSPRFWALLPADLRGVVVELNEAAGPLGDDALVRVVDRLRSRGARIALDDLGGRGDRADPPRRSPTGHHQDRPRPGARLRRRPRSRGSHQRAGGVRRYPGRARLCRGTGAVHRSPAAARAGRHVRPGLPGRRTGPPLAHRSGDRAAVATISCLRLSRSDRPRGVRMVEARPGPATGNYCAGVRDETTRGGTPMTRGARR
jgi:diguanylate cyclase (GGDEF)-like protein